MLKVKSIYGEETVLVVGDVVSFKGRRHRVTGFNSGMNTKGEWGTLVGILEFSSGEAIEPIEVGLDEVEKIYGTNYLNVYRLHQVYGGPEEGGWYYEAGEPVSFIRLKDCETLEKIEELKEYFDGSFGRGNWEGDEIWITVQNHPAKSYPETRPRYE